MIPTLNDLDSKFLHIENGASSNLLVDYPKSIVDISFSRKDAIEKFKRAKKWKLMIFQL